MTKINGSQGDNQVSKVTKKNTPTTEKQYGWQKEKTGNAFGFKEHNKHYLAFKAQQEQAAQDAANAEIAAKKDALGLQMKEIQNQIDKLANDEQEEKIVELKEKIAAEEAKPEEEQNKQLLEALKYQLERQETLKEMQEIRQQIEAAKLEPDSEEKTQKLEDLNAQLDELKDKLKESSEDRLTDLKSKLEELNKQEDSEEKTKAVQEINEEIKSIKEAMSEDNKARVDALKAKLAELHEQMKGLDDSGEENLDITA